MVNKDETKQQKVIESVMSSDSERDSSEDARNKKNNFNINNGLSEATIKAIESK